MSATNITSVRSWTTMLKSAVNDSTKFKWFIDLTGEALENGAINWIRFHSAWGKDPSAKSTYVQYEAMLEMCKVLDQAQTTHESLAELKAIYDEFRQKEHKEQIEIPDLTWQPEESQPTFEVTPDEPEVSNFVSSEVANEEPDEEFVKQLEEYKQQAIDEQFPYEQVEAAAAVSSPSNCHDYDAFLTLINSVFQREQEKIRREKALHDQKVAQIRVSINRLNQISDIGLYANGEIIKVYKTSAVTLMDIMHYATAENLHLDLYENPTYSIILQMHTQWVKDIVDKVLHAWDTEDYPHNYVETYLQQIGKNTEDFDKDCDYLIGIGTNTVMRYENDPKIYLAFVAVQQLLRQSNIDEDTYRNQVFSNSQRMVNYISLLEADIDDGMPIKVAEVHASEFADEMLDRKIEAHLADEVSQVQSEQPTESEDVSHFNPIVAAAGGVAKLQGNYIRMKYDMAKAKDDMLKESLGDNYDEYMANQAIIQQRKDEIKSRKQEFKHQQQMRKEEQKMRMAEMQAEAEMRAEERRIEEQAMEREDRRAMRRQGFFGNGNTYNINGNPGYGYEAHQGMYGSNKTGIGVKVPPILIAIIVDIFLALIGALLTSKGALLILGGCLFLSILGFIKLNHKEQGALFVIAGGYLLYFVAMFFFLSMK